MKAQGKIAAVKEAVRFIYEEGGIQEYQLDNGLKVLLVENHSAPVVTVLVVYKVGSRNEAAGYTGSTHFLEHMLFKGSPSFNKQKGTQIAHILMREGAHYNATTWLDRTTYYETLPANKLELAFQIESERMRHAFIRNADRQAEMSVVRNELERHENEPDSIMWTQLFANAYQAHPYHHPTIGWHSDVEGVPTTRLKKFYDEFYYPNNATLIVVGDIHTDQTLSQIQHYFGPVSASKKPIPSMYTAEFPQQGQRRFVVKRPGQLGIVQMAFHVPPLEHHDSYALDILQDILSDGVTSRLYQALVEKHLALYAGAYNLQLRDPGLFILTAKVASGIAHELVEQTMMEVLEELKHKPVKDKELAKVKNQTKAAFVYNRHGTYQLAAILAEFESMASWRYLLSYMEYLNKVTPQDLQAVVSKYFRSDNQTVGHFIPEAAETVVVTDRHLDIYHPTEVGKSRKTNKKSVITKAPIVRFPFGHEGLLVVQENHLDNTVALRGHIKAGTIFDPPDKPGLASMTASMLNKGTQHHTKLQIAEALAFMGSSLDFRIGLEGVNFYGRCLSENLPETLNLLYEILKHPVFPVDEFEKLRKQRLDAIKQRLDSTDDMAYQLLYQDLYPPNHPLYQTSVADLSTATQQMALKDIKAFYKKHYGSHQMILVVVGDVVAEKMQHDIQAQLGQWQVKNPAPKEIATIPLQKKGKDLFYALPDKANVSILMGHQTPLKRTSPEFFPAMLANHALGQSSLSSRLGLRIRDDLGLTYGIHSSFADVGMGAGTWLISVSTNPENIQRTLAESKAVVQKYIRSGISAVELADAKSAMIGSYLVSLATNPEIAYRLLQIELYQLGLDYFQKRAELIEMVSQSTVNQAIRDYFHPEKLTIAIAGRYDQQPE